jgi:hypothetical protein
MGHGCGLSRRTGTGVTGVQLRMQREKTGDVRFVLEAYTLQVLPAAVRSKAIARIAGLLAVDATLQCLQGAACSAGTRDIPQDRPGGR